MFDNLKEILHNLSRDKTFHKIVIIFIISKVIILSGGFAGSFLPDVTHRIHVVDNEFLNGWAQYDASGYLDVAENGYNAQFHNNSGNYSLYPFLPLLIKIFSFVGYATAAFLIVNIASFLAVIALYLLVKGELKSEKLAYKTLFYFLLFPTIYFMTAMYTEAIFVFLAVTMFLCARHEKWLYAGLLGFCLSLTRIHGIIIFIPMLYMYLSSRRHCVWTPSASKHNGVYSLLKIQNINKSILYLFLTPLGFVSFMLYQFIVTGNALIQFMHFSQYAKQISYPWTSVIGAISAIIHPNSLSMLAYNFVNLSVFVLLTIATIYAFKYLKPEYGIYIVVNLLIVLVSSNLNGIGRYVLLMFPVFIVMAIASEKNRKLGTLLKITYIAFVIALFILSMRHVNEGIYLTFTMAF